ncbi:MAG TPA: methyltransferase [Candidatus Baltobacteraceae bacterium]|jgi:23S rRNA G2445 N2-methylase RlmL|nr:methyltransferase [Candidatus Baltobacteraceae bacterium]
MTTEERERAKNLYKHLRGLAWHALWSGEVARFNAGTREERTKGVAVIRAVGVVFAESGPAEQRAQVQEWLLDLLQDPSEKVRRYAMAAMPKIGAGAKEEKNLLSALRTTTEEREKKFLVRTLGRIGGPAALEQGLPVDAEQKVKASLAREEHPSAVRIHVVLADFQELRIHLRGRAGLERIVSDEVEQRNPGKFRVTEVRSGRVTIVPVAPFTLAEIYAMRCFGTAGFVLGHAEGANETESIEALATVMTSPLSRRLLQTFTEGSIRYRLNLVSKGHQRAVVSRLASRVYARCPEILNDARKVTWTIDIYPDGRGHLVELRPNMTPDPRFSYRQKDVPAASHPPLAACLARLAGRTGNEVIWDPFCGSGLELIESAMLGGVRSVYGTDRSAEAVGIAQINFAAAKVESVPAKFICGDFRDISRGRDPAAGTVTLIITNPPMGMRVPVANLRQLIEDLFGVAVTMLRPGGRLVFVNPLSMETPHASLKLQFRQKVDLGGFEARLEKYLKIVK